MMKTFNDYLSMNYRMEIIEDLLGLSTIHFYIILKPNQIRRTFLVSLSTIHFYIILKHYLSAIGRNAV